MLLPGQGHTCTTGTVVWQWFCPWQKTRRSCLFWEILPHQLYRLAQALLWHCSTDVPHLKARRWLLGGVCLKPALDTARPFLLRHVPVSKCGKGVDTLKSKLLQACTPGCYKTKTSQRTHQLYSEEYSPELSCGQRSALFLGKTQ